MRKSWNQSREAIALHLPPFLLKYLTQRHFFDFVYNLFAGLMLSSYWQPDDLSIHNARPMAAILLWETYSNPFGVEIAQVGRWIPKAYQGGARRRARGRLLYHLDQSVQCMQNIALTLLDELLDYEERRKFVCWNSARILHRKRQIQTSPRDEQNT
jgi:hypothetical protein